MSLALTFVERRFAQPSEEKCDHRGEMRSTVIPNTELKPSVICFGTAGLGSTIERDAAFRLLDVYLDRGGTFIDTAHNYADWIEGERSRSEKLIGEWLTSRAIQDHPRDQGCPSRKQLDAFRARRS